MLPFLVVSDTVADDVLARQIQGCNFAPVLYDRGCGYNTFGPVPTYPIRPRHMEVWMDGSHFDAWTRRSFGVAAGGLAGSLLTIAGHAAPRRRRARRKRRSARSLASTATTARSSAAVVWRVLRQIPAAISVARSAARSAVPAKSVAPGPAPATTASARPMGSRAVATTNAARSTARARASSPIRRVSVPA